MFECDAAVGVFDSGVGGLTVARRIMERLPYERLVYLGDTARVPYGTKSPETVIRYAFACSRILLAHHLKLLVVACNTASSCAIQPLRDELEVPVVGVVDPGAQAAVKASRNGRIGVIGTPGTIASGAYQQAILALEPGLDVFVKACPLFVPLAEEGWVSGPIPRQVAESYLGDLRQNGIDTLVLGCTHYPLLREVIADTMGPQVILIDSAEAAAQVVEETITSMRLHANQNGRPKHRFLVSDSPEGFVRASRHFVADGLDDVQWVDF